MTEANIAFVANLLADPSRAAMCLSLAGGEARPAGELAARAGVSAQTASNHLAKLIAGRHPARRAAGTLALLPPGRRRGGPRRRGAGGRRAARCADPVAGNGLDGAARRLQSARTCYSHLAGRLGVALADALVAAAVDGGGRPQLPAHARPAPARCARSGSRCAARARRPRRGGAWTGRSAGRTWPARWARRWRAWPSIAAGSDGCGGPGRWPSRRRGASQLKKVFNVRWEERP